MVNHQSDNDLGNFLCVQFHELFLSTRNFVKLILIMENMETIEMTKIVLCISHISLKTQDIWINPYWQILENSSRNFSKIFIFWVVTQAVLLENSSSFFFEIQILGRHTGRFTGKLIHSNFEYITPRGIILFCSSQIQIQLLVNLIQFLLTVENS